METKIYVLRGLENGGCERATMKCKVERNVLRFFRKFRSKLYYHLVVE